MIRSLDLDRNADETGLAQIATLTPNRERKLSCTVLRGE
jgi:hypothetical protein